MNEGFFGETPKRFARPTAAWVRRLGRPQPVGGFFMSPPCCAISQAFAICVPLGLGRDRHRHHHPGPLHAAADRERLRRQCSLEGVQALSAEPGEVHQGRGCDGDLRALSAVRGGVRAGAELHPQVRSRWMRRRRPGGSRTAIRGPITAVARARRPAGGRSSVAPAMPHRCRARGAAPSLDDMSRGMGTSLAGMSAGLGTMLVAGPSTLTSAPSSSGVAAAAASRRRVLGGGGFSGGGGGGGGSSFG